MKKIKLMIVGVAAISFAFIGKTAISTQISQPLDDSTEVAITKEAGSVLFQGKTISWTENTCIGTRKGKVDTIFGSSRKNPGEKHTILSVVGSNISYKVETANATFYRCVYMDNPSRPIRMDEIFNVATLLNLLKTHPDLKDLGIANAKAANSTGLANQIKATDYNYKKIPTSFGVYEVVNDTATLKIMLPKKGSATEGKVITLKIPVQTTFKPMFNEANGKTLMKDLGTE